MQDNNDQVEFIRGSGNVFADLGLPNPEERLAKARLMHIINSEIKRRGLRQRTRDVKYAKEIVRLAYGLSEF